MSSEQTLPTSDLRSTAQDYKRAAARKHKWQLGALERVSRGAGNPRPYKPKETAYTIRRLESKAGIIHSNNKVLCRRDMLDGGNLPSDDSAGSGSDFDDAPPSPPADAGIMYSFDAARGPSHGSQILNVALAKAVERFEEKETAKLVRNEYEILDSDGESIGLTPSKKGKDKAKEVTPVSVDEDEEYEFV